MKKLGYSIKSLSKSADIGKDLIYSEINNGNLKSIKFKRRRIIRPAAAEEWLKKLEQRTSKKMGFEDSES